MDNSIVFHELFSMLQDDHHAVLCVSGPNSVKTNDFIISDDKIFLSVVKRSNNRSLKVMEERKKIYCRLIFISLNQILLNF